MAIYILLLVWRDAKNMSRVLYRVMIKESLRHLHHLPVFRYRPYIEHNYLPHRALGCSILIF